LKEYEIVFKSGEAIYILAEDLEDAAWSAYDIARELNTTIKDVMPTHVKKEILSKQLACRKVCSR